MCPCRPSCTRTLPRRLARSVCSSSRVSRASIHAHRAAHAPSATGLYLPTATPTRVQRALSAEASTSAHRRRVCWLDRRSARPRSPRWRCHARHLALVAVEPPAPAVGAQSRPRHPKRGGAACPKRPASLDATTDCRHAASRVGANRPSAANAAMATAIVETPSRPLSCSRPLPFSPREALPPLKMPPLSAANRAPQQPRVLMRAQSEPVPLSTTADDGGQIVRRVRSEPSRPSCAHARPRQQQQLQRGRSRCPQPCRCCSCSPRCQTAAPATAMPACAASPSSSQRRRPHIGTPARVIAS